MCLIRRTDMTQLEQYLMLAIVTVVAILATVIVMQWESIRKARTETEWRAAAHDELITWLATNLGKTGDFKRSEENSNVIAFRPRQ